mmetsp:Transcript_37168/g.71721  ORF Transcript_37168/g.71721 Transcript_37168/m.71721 type:complete len:222 (+) Transcript_37168:1-666(+)
MLHCCFGGRTSRTRRMSLEEGKGCGVTIAQFLDNAKLGSYKEAMEKQCGYAPTDDAAELIKSDLGDMQKHVKKMGMKTGHAARLLRQWRESREKFDLVPIYCGCSCDECHVMPVKDVLYIDRDIKKDYGVCKNCYADVSEEAKKTLEKMCSVDDFMKFMFKTFDTNSDQKITKAEFLSHPLMSPSVRTWLEIQEEFDINKDDLLDFEEFKAMWMAISMSGP